MDRQTDARTEHMGAQIDTWTHRCTDGQMTGQTDSLKDRQVQTDGKMDGYLDRKTDEWLESDRQIDEWTYRWDSSLMDDTDGKYSSGLVSRLGPDQFPFKFLIHPQR